MGLNGDTEPKTLIHELSEALLEQFEGAPLIDAYAVYQHLMDYWAETLQDDLYAIVQDGWQAAARPRELVAEKGRKHKETPDLAIGGCASGTAPPDPSSASGAGPSCG